MSRFRVKIAEHVIEIRSVYDRVYNICKKYLTSDEPQLRINVKTEDIYNERLTQEFVNNTLVPDDYIETLCVLRKLADELIDEGVFLLHGAAISVHDTAVIFTADSGVGKSVHVFRWLINNKDTMVINGDKPFIIANDLPKVCGSPWAGKEGLNADIIKPLKAIVLLQRSEHNAIRQISFEQAFPLLLRQVYRPNDSIKVKKTLHLIKQMSQHITFWQYECNNYKKDGYDIVYNALFKHDETETT